MKPREIDQNLRKLGWYYSYSTGGHDFYEHPSIKGKIPVPQHPGDVSPTVLSKIRKKAGF
ncbi:MAG: type II toxin-antitoxin system HicA family toxin [Oscillospiraceae bacterium]|nr:type II toxin-antitoxin system HicA family toxin [Oscillospiraceae bacterium]